MTSSLTIRIEREVKPVSCESLVFVGFVDVDSLKSVDLKDGFCEMRAVMWCFKAKG